MQPTEPKKTASDSESPDFELHEIVEIITESLPKEDLLNTFGVVCAVREEAGACQFVVKVCTTGVGLTCPEGKHFIFGAEDIRSTGRESFPVSHSGRTWPLPSLPKFQLFEKVELLRGALDEQPVPGPNGVVCDPPSCHDDEWYYSVAICRAGDDCECETGLVYEFDEAQLRSDGARSRQYYRMLARPPKLGENEIVLVLKSAPGFSETEGKLGVIQGTAQQRDGRCTYVIDFYDLEETYIYDEETLLGTGKFDDSDWQTAHAQVSVSADSSSTNGVSAESLEKLGG
jgi:hypothetical protein